ncbi:branched-chain amino acid ABC transporter permease [Ideonella livida]|uniref:Branched-chain amino acid ABC transporter permease n=1 Tax=Ideonella livida TaxID=2707176 RepID=A0A7C9PHF0_9BURK|nr:branched-chain amino acid ABC transporter permease [Ideonella livida]NDY91808.1 branched-chain amino acid ABC transporter permease [Ideonella livida]
MLLLNILIDGLAYGMVLFVIAVGLSVTLGLMRFVNLSHGALATVGGYLAAVFTRELGWPFLPAVAAAVLGCGLLGAALEQGVLRHLYRRSELSQVLFTIGLSFFAVASLNALAGPQVQLIAWPAWLQQPVDLGFRTLPAQRLAVIVCGLAVAVGVGFVATRTRFGVWLRAAVDHPEAAAALGIPIRRVQCLTFAAGAALAGLGGVLGAELMPLEPYHALKYLVLVLVVVAVGGMGSVAGSLLAAVLLGTVDTAGKYLTDGWGPVAFFVAMAALLAWRPHGLLQRG